MMGGWEAGCWDNARKALEASERPATATDATEVSEVAEGHDLPVSDDTEPHGPRCAQRFHGAAECDCEVAEGADTRSQRLTRAFADLLLQQRETFLREQRRMTRDFSAKLDALLMELDQ
jgi:hypothetical protein